MNKDCITLKMNGISVAHNQ